MLFMERATNIMMKGLAPTSLRRQNMQSMQVFLANPATLACSRFPRGFWSSYEYVDCYYQNKDSLSS